MHRFFSEVEKEWQCDQREDKKHLQIPEVEPHPGEISAECVEAVEIVRIELDKRASKLWMAYTLDVNMQGYEYNKCAEQEGYGKSFEPLPDKLSACPVTQGIIYTETGK